LRLVTFEFDNRIEPGVMVDGQVVSMWHANFTSVAEIVAGGADAMDRVTRWIPHATGRATPDMAQVKLLAPLPRPNKIICIGLNYRDHAEEGKMAIPDVPTVFCKFATSIIGPGHPIVLPKNSTKPDYEAEFVIVIGKRGRHIPEEKWRDYVFGYSILNDVSARDFQMATSQWTMGKTFDTFAPFGPEIVTADEIEDPHNLNISLELNGETMQNSNTRNMIFQTPQLIAFLSSVFTLEPGDIISTGTPAGVGFARKPPRWLRPGDQVTVRIEKLGALTNPVVAEA
jgi:2-keto-4-pentenoate hydratase/2-oxohepta-3-ene-1,7-dioic acid hydratase in catechol pathway